MKKFLEIGLGIVTGVGGFLDIGSITTAAQAGALYGFQLAWAIVLGALCIIFLAEQSGRLAAISHRTITDAIRERFGSNYFIVLFGVLGVVMLLALGAELGGVCIAVEFMTGIDYRWWAVPVALVGWLTIWFGNFAVIEEGVAALGLVTISFAVVAVMLHPDWIDVAKGLLPTTPDHDSARYWFLASNILGASITPYLMFFYSSGAIEDRWDRSHLVMNRIIASLGMGLGAFISVAVLVVAAQVLAPRGIAVDHYAQLGLLMTDALGAAGFWILAVSIAIPCFSTALEVALSVAYMAAQGFGWNGSQNGRPKDNARFCTTYTGAIVIGVLLLLAGVSPVRLTNIAMALTSATLPVAVLPFLFIMNDRSYMKDQRNGWLSNAVVLFTMALACVLAVVTIPLEISSGG